MKNDELTELVQILNPNKEEGKLVLITRYGHDKIDGLLPGHIEAVKASGVPVVWQCDGVHGNTVTAKSVSAHSDTRPPAPPPRAAQPARQPRRAAAAADLEHRQRQLHWPARHRPRRVTRAP